MMSYISFYILDERGFYSNSNLLIPVSLQPIGVHLWYSKIGPFDLAEFKIWYDKGIRH